MSQVKLLIDVISDLQHLADSLSACAQAMTTSERMDDYKKIYPPEEIESPEIKIPKSENEISENEIPENPITIEEFRTALGEKMRAGYSTEVKALLMKHGANKLSKIDKSKYAALLKEADKIGS